MKTSRSRAQAALFVTTARTAGRMQLATTGPARPESARPDAPARQPPTRRPRSRQRPLRCPTRNGGCRRNTWRRPTAGPAIPAAWSTRTAPTTRSTGTTRPARTSAGAVDWAHATSTDLVNWTDQPVAVSRNRGRSRCSPAPSSRTPTTPRVSAPTPSRRWSRSTPTLVDDGQSLAYSTDHGQTWQQYSGNPVLESGIAGETPPRSQGLLVPAGRVLGAGRDRHRRLRGAAVQVEEPDGLDLPERGHRRRVAGGPVAEPGPVPARSGRRSGQRQMGDAGQHRRRSRLPRHRLDHRDQRQQRSRRGSHRRPPARRSSTSSDRSTARPSPRSRSAPPGSAPRSPERCSPGWIGARTSRRQRRSAARRTAGRWRSAG